MYGRRSVSPQFAGVDIVFLSVGDEVFGGAFEGDVAGSVAGGVDGGAGDAGFYVGRSGGAEVEGAALVGEIGVA